MVPCQKHSNVFRLQLTRSSSYEMCLVKVGPRKQSGVVGLHNNGKGYKGISKCLGIHQSTVKQTVCWCQISSLATTPLAVVTVLQWLQYWTLSCMLATQNPHWGIEKNTSNSWRLKVITGGSKHLRSWVPEPAGCPWQNVSKGTAGLWQTSGVLQFLFF